ncbi:hypothetical protein GCM10010530_15850 [Kribbella aluminosa]
MVLTLLGMPVAAPVERPQIEWHQCRLDAADEEGAALDRAGAECGDLKVPLDYARPDGPKITLALSRLRATGERIGAMVLNDGGPGGPGLSMPLRLRPEMKAAGTRYDLIGLDPRFVGRSTPIDCKLPYAAWPWAGGADRASFDRVSAQVADVARRCGANAGQYLQYVNTRNTARDIDQVRAALGERKISYLGYSYGTYLGSVYLQLFPGRTDRVLLDGPIDPVPYGPRLLRTIGPANESALRSWATWAAARNSTYHLGRRRRRCWRRWIGYCGSRGGAGCRSGSTGSTTEWCRCCCSGRWRTTGMRRGRRTPGSSGRCSTRRTDRCSPGRSWAGSWTRC